MMNPFNSTYNISYSNIGVEAEIDRLKAQVEMSWEKEFRNLKWLGLSNGMKILEVGCGPGFVTEKLAEGLPQSNISALDIDKNLLATAEQRLNKVTNTNVEFKTLNLSMLLCMIQVFLNMNMILLLPD